MALRFSRKNGLLQLALDYVDTGIMPDYEFENQEERDYFDNTVKEIRKDRANGNYFEYSVGDYDDD